MRTKLALLATTALAVMAVAAPAQAAGSGWYLSLSGGANWLNDNDFVASNGVDTVTFNSESDTGFFIGGAVGYSLGQLVTPGLRVEVEVAYRQNQVDGDWASTTGGENDSGLLDYDHSTTSVMANAWYDFDVGGLKPYVGGGIGWADVNVDGNYVGALDPILDYSDDGFAWQVGGGINFQVAPNMQLGLGYRYFSGPDVTILAPNLPTNTLTQDLEYDNHTVLATISFGM
ncbi:MAG: outer membrane beta-barrel protein [Alphaproteobacteria bacterium]|nr:outer membrane beta-barrel protein [Alphaproteobacteria bacterium]